MENIVADIRRMAKEQDAAILAHYYVDGAIQDVADYVGDSFYLAKIAQKVKNQTIVFCGVTFMGESASIIAPDKTVLMPDDEAVCPMALMADEQEIRAVREQYDDLAVVCYINSMAATKALCDVCVTSSNALKIVRQLPQKNIYFIPDQHLGSWIAEQLPEKNFIFGSGYCHVHHAIHAEDVREYRRKYPGVKVLTHPECPLEVSQISDYVGSTSGIIQYATEHDDAEFIICTESGVKHELKKRNPGKTFHFIENDYCQNMRLLTLDSVAECLLRREPVAKVPAQTAAQARGCLDRMLELAGA